VRILLLFLLVGAPGCHGSSGKVEQARLLLETANTLTEASDATRRAALNTYWQNRITTALDDPPCRFDLPSDSADPRLQIVSDRDLQSFSGPQRAVFASANTRLMADILIADRPNRAEADEFSARAESVAAPWPWDISIITDEYSRPRYTHEGVYFPGMVAGQVVVWNYETGRVECAARVASTNSPDVIDRGRGAESDAFEADTLAFLEEDLRVRTWALALGDLREFGADVPSAEDSGE
jgi:hypothetical protein